MTKETLKVKVARLEQENQKLREEKKLDMEAILKLNNEITQMQAKADQDFVNSPTKKQYEDQIQFQTNKIDIQGKRLNREVEKNEKLLDEIEKMKGEIDDLKAQKIKNRQKVHNERNAGRKLKIDEKTILQVQMYRAQGKTIKETSELVGLSYGSVQKISKIKL
jgi:hypothetical protein